jgi:ribokinase
LAGKIIVVGSFVYDLIVWLLYFPHKGETLLTSDFRMYAGGKGFNQAVATRRAGAQVDMIGKVGADYFGDTFLQLQRREGIDHSFVIRDAAANTSLGIPMINLQGENSIIGVPRANTLVTTAEVRRVAGFISQHEIHLNQIVIPLEASLEAARIAHQAGLLVSFNPAPAAFPLTALLPSDDSGQPLVDWLIPNEVEAEILSSVPVKTPEEAFKSGQIILSQGVERGVIITIGSYGVAAVAPSGHVHGPSYQVTQVDPTGAGDASRGAFTATLSDGQSLEMSLRFADAAGALAATMAGVEPSLPQRAKIDTFLRNKT